MMKKRGIRGGAGAALLAFGLGLSLHAHAGLLDPIADLTVGAFLDRVQEAANGIVDHAAAQGSGLLVQTGDEANLVAGNARIELNDVLQKKVVDVVDRNEQAILAAVLDAENKLKAATLQIYDLKDTTLLDIANMEAAVPFTHLADFYVQRILHVAYLKNAGGYAMTVYAHGLGISSDNPQPPEISVTIDGQPVALEVAPDQTTLGKAVIALPATVVDPLFHPTHLKTPKVVLTVRITKKGWFGTSLFGSTHTYTVPFWLNLYPALAATATMHSVVPTYEWVDVADAYGPINTSPNKNGCTKQECEAGNSVEVRVPGAPSGAPIEGGQRITSLRLECTEGDSICNFVDTIKPTIDANATHGTITFNTNSFARHWRAIAKVQEWRQTRTTYYEEPLTFYYDRQTQGSLDTLANPVTLDVITFSGIKYSMPMRGPDQHSIVQFVSRTPNALGPHTDAVLFSTQAPTGF
ncbi:hypothetical protein [Ralstonia solanacearum]|uniref:Uncharacterized protein n=1 Tax=Ralstonia solanacearum TaxID=305 RepID=A0AAE3T5J9_RALSL|nr:hypothetical protein [Ralstonia solanacearum]MBB6580937.1 hypothetical protein [Ralstonia solanacearum]MDB0524304.1 hypothetical protein [Ralstonia solanacearum]